MAYAYDNNDRTYVALERILKKTYVYLNMGSFRKEITNISVNGFFE